MRSVSREKILIESYNPFNLEHPCSCYTPDGKEDILYSTKTVQEYTDSLLGGSPISIHEWTPLQQSEKPRILFDHWCHGAIGTSYLNTINCKSNQITRIAQEMDTGSSIIHGSQYVYNDTLPLNKYCGGDGCQIPNGSTHHTPDIVRICRACIEHTQYLPTMTHLFSSTSGYTLGAYMYYPDYKPPFNGDKNGTDGWPRCVYCGKERRDHTPFNAQNITNLVGHLTPI